VQNVATGPLINRMLGAARLDANTYEEVEHDQNGTTGALIVVILAAIAAGIGSIRADGVSGLIAGIVSGIVGWAVFAGFAYFVGTRLIPGRETSSSWGELLRTLGFAETPMILTVFGFIPILGAIISFVAWVWYVIASVVALRQALDMSTGRAIAVGIISIIAEGIVVGIILGILGVAAYGLGAL